MNLPDKYSDFVEYNIDQNSDLDTEANLINFLFHHRKAKNRFHSPLAKGIKEASGFDEELTELEVPFEVRKRWAREQETFAYIDNDPIGAVDFAKHELIYLKPDEIEDFLLSQRVKAYLEFCEKTIISNSELDITDNGENLPMNQKVNLAFKFMKNLDPRKRKSILSKEDYAKLIKWVTEYFTNDLSIPEITNPIKKVETSKGNVVSAFKRFYKKEYPQGFYPDSLFNFLKSCFFEFRNDSIENLKKTRVPDNYDDLIRKAK